MSVSTSSHHHHAFGFISVVRGLGRMMRKIDKRKEKREKGMSEC